MTVQETRQYEMLERVRQFGEAHRGDFPDTSKGGVAFAAVAAALKALAESDDEKTKSSEDGRQAKADARDALAERLQVVSRTARLIGTETSGFGDRFKLPEASRPTDQALLGTGRIFADEAESVKERFLAHDLPETFIADLRNLVEMFGQAIRERESGKEQRAVARGSVTKALSTGLAAVRALDVLVANRLGGDDKAMTAWEHDRRVERPRRVRNRQVTAAALPAPASAAPAATLAPAPTPAAVVAAPEPSISQPELVAREHVR